MSWYTPEQNTCVQHMKYILMDLSHRYAVEVLDDIFVCLSQKKSLCFCVCVFFHGAMWNGKPWCSQKEHQLVSAIKGAAYIIKKWEFKSDGQKGPRQPLPCTVYKLGFQFHCFWLWGRGGRGERGGSHGSWSSRREFWWKGRQSNEN